MKITIVLLATIGCALAYPQYTQINGHDGARSFYQDASGQLSQSYSTHNIQQSDQLTLIPVNGDLVPLTRTDTRYTAPDGQVVITLVEAGPQGAKISGSHVPTA